MHRFGMGAKLSICRFEVSKYDACTRFRIHLKGVVISDYSYEPSHYSCIRSLGEWLSSQGIPGIYGVDTRAITKVIRESGSMLGKLVVQGSTPSVNLEIDDPNHRNLVAEVSRKEKEVFVPCGSIEKTGSCLGRGLRSEEQHHQAQQLPSCTF